MEHDSSSVWQKIQRTPPAQLPAVLDSLTPAQLTQVGRKALYEKVPAAGLEPIERERVEAIFENVFARFDLIGRATHPTAGLATSQQPSPV